MYKSFTAENFRCFDNLQLDDLQRINLISGKNNVGKTALLEALFIYAGAFIPDLTIKVNAFRGIEQFRIEQGLSAEMPWDSVFREFDSQIPIRLFGVTENNVERELTLSVAEQIGRELRSFNQDNSIDMSSINPQTKGLKLESTQQDERLIVSYAYFTGKGIDIRPVIPAPHPTIFNGARMRVPPDEDARRLSHVDSRDEPIVLEVFRVIEPRLQDIKVRDYNGTFMLHGDIPDHERPYPIYLMGEGLARLASIVYSIANAEGGVVLIDEIENGLHYSVQVDIWRALAKAARHFDVQLFATTHSFEMIQAAYRAFRDDDPYDFNYCRLERINGTIKALAYDKDMLEIAIDSGLEVR